MELVRFEPVPLAFSGRRWARFAGGDSALHGSGERSAVSGARRLRRPVTPGRKELPAEDARWS
jgi:hypothetical protein